MAIGAIQVTSVSESGVPQAALFTNVDITTDPATEQPIVNASGGPGALQRITVDVPLATLQGKTSGDPFDVLTLSAPPAGFHWRVIGSEVVVNSELLSSDESFSAATVEIGQSGGNPDAFCSAISVFGLTTGAAVNAPGTNTAPSQTGPYTLTVTLTDSTMAELTQGDLSVNLYLALTT
jgi:hypothetical protein